MAIMGATQLYENPHAKIRTGISLVSRLCAFGDIWVDTDCLLDCFLVFSRCEKPIKSSFRDIDNLVECVAMFFLFSIIQTYLYWAWIVRQFVCIFVCI